MTVIAPAISLGTDPGGSQAVTAHQRHPLATVIKYHGDRDTAHPEHVLREPRMTGNLNIRQADPTVVAGPVLSAIRP